MTKFAWLHYGYIDLGFHMLFLESFLHAQKLRRWIPACGISSGAFDELSVLLQKPGFLCFFGKLFSCSKIKALNSSLWMECLDLLLSFEAFDELSVIFGKTSALQAPLIWEWAPLTKSLAWIQNSIYKWMYMVYVNFAWIRKSRIANEKQQLISEGLSGQGKTLRPDPFQISW